MWKHSWASILCFREHSKVPAGFTCAPRTGSSTLFFTSHFGWKENGNPAVEHPLTLREVPSIYLDSNTLKESQALRGWGDADMLCDSLLQLLLGE